MYCIIKKWNCIPALKQNETTLCLSKSEMYSFGLSWQTLWINKEELSLIPPNVGQIHPQNQHTHTSLYLPLKSSWHHTVIQTHTHTSISITSSLWWAHTLSIPLCFRLILIHHEAHPSIHNSFTYAQTHTHTHAWNKINPHPVWLRACSIKSHNVKSAWI